MTNQAEDDSTRLARTKELVKEQLQSRQTGITFIWRNVPVSVDWIDGATDGPVAIVDARLGQLPFARQNPVGRQHALILATHHRDKLGGRYIVRRNGEVLYRARMRLAKPQSPEERATLAARLAIQLRPCLTEMRAYVLSGPVKSEGSFRKRLVED